MSWWQLGQDSGYHGTKLSLWQIACAFCGERGNWELAHHAEKKKPNDNQRLNFDTYKCGNCAGFVMVFWSAGDALHDYRVLPAPQVYSKFPEPRSYLPDRTCLRNHGGILLVSGLTGADTQRAQLARPWWRRGDVPSHCHRNDLVAVTR